MPRSRICGRGAKVLPLHLNTPIGIQRPYSMLSLPNIRSQLFMTVCNLPFAIGAHLDHFLVDDDVVDLDLRPPDSEAQRRKRNGLVLLHRKTAFSQQHIVLIIQLLALHIPMVVHCHLTSRSNLRSKAIQYQARSSSISFTKPASSRSCV